MAASSLLLLRLSEYLRARKIAIAGDAAAGCHDEGRARPEEEANVHQNFPWATSLQTMIQGTADALLASTAHEGTPAARPTVKGGASSDIQLLLSDAWLVRNAFLRALNRFQGEQSGKKVDFTAMEMTEARQEAVQEFDRQISAALSDWIAGTSHRSSVSADSVRDLYDGMRAIQGVLQMAANGIPAGSKAHVAAAAQQLGRLASIAHELIDGPQHEQARTAIAPPVPLAAKVPVALAIAPLDVPTFVRSLAEAARPAALKRSVRVDALCNPGPQILKTDGAKLHRAATLLIDSSIAFTEQGEISITSGVGEAKQWTLEIRDSSPGIPPTILNKLLDGVGLAPETAPGGRDPTLGITLARDLIHLLGGRLLGTSEPGEGNCFVIELKQ